MSHHFFSINNNMACRMLMWTHVPIGALSMRNQPNILPFNARCHPCWISYGYGYVLASQIIICETPTSPATGTTLPLLAFATRQTHSTRPNPVVVVVPRCCFSSAPDWLGLLTEKQASQEQQSVDLPACSRSTCTIVTTMEMYCR